MQDSKDKANQNDPSLVLYIDEKPEKKRKALKYLLPLLAVAFLLAGLGAVVYMVQEQTDVRSRAYSLVTEELIPPEITPSPQFVIENSYVFASPLRAKSEGEIIRITVFVLDGRGLGVEGVSVLIPPREGLLLDNQQVSTNQTGEAVFNLSSRRPGAYIIEPTIDGKPLGQKVTISFE